MRTLGIDYGKKRIGLAISDEHKNRVALPFCTLENQPDTFFERIQKIVANEQVKKIVVGLPLQMQGNEGLATFRVNKFVQALKEKLNIPIYLFDERWSTVEAQSKLHSLSVNSKKQKKIIDEAAAQIILQNFLDTHSSDNETSSKG